MGVGIVDHAYFFYTTWEVRIFGSRTPAKSLSLAVNCLEVGNRFDNASSEDEDATFLPKQYHTPNLASGLNLLVYCGNGLAVSP